MITARETAELLGCNSAKQFQDVERLRKMVRDFNAIGCTLTFEIYIAGARRFLRSEINLFITKTVDAAKVRTSFNKKTKLEFIWVYFIYLNFSNNIIYSDTAERIDSFLDHFKSSKLARLEIFFLSAPFLVTWQTDLTLLLLEIFSFVTALEKDHCTSREMKELYSFKTHLGTFFICRLGATVLLVVFKKKVGSGYDTPQEAAFALAYGTELMLPVGADPATLGVSPNLIEWNRSAEADFNQVQHLTFSLTPIVKYLKFNPFLQEI